MKKIRNQGPLEGFEIVKVKIDPNTLKGDILMPKVHYKVITTAEVERVFNGMILPIPRVLMYFLNHTELQLIGMIMEETATKGECYFCIKDYATRLNITNATVSASLYKLRRKGLLIEAGNGRRGRGKIRKINYKTISHLDNLVEGEDIGVFTRLKKVLKQKFIITNITKADIHNAYDNKVLPPIHDPEEEEEYD